jgi:hypothetical protein
MIQLENDQFLVKFSSFLDGEASVRIAFKRFDYKIQGDLYPVLVHLKVGSNKYSTLVQPDDLEIFAEKYSNVCKTRMQLAKKQRNKK